MKPKVSSPATVSEPPVVTESTQSDVRNNYEQGAARRKGLLSTILSNRRSSEASGTTGNSTLG